MRSRNLNQAGTEAEHPPRSVASSVYYPTDSAGYARERSLRRMGLGCGRESSRTGMPFLDSSQAPSPVGNVNMPLKQSDANLSMYVPVDMEVKVVTGSEGPTPAVGALGRSACSVIELQWDKSLPELTLRSTSRWLQVSSYPHSDLSRDSVHLLAASCGPMKQVFAGEI